MVIRFGEKSLKYCVSVIEMVRNDIPSLPAWFSQAAVHFISHPSSVVLIFLNVWSISTCPKSISEGHLCEKCFV